MSHTCFVYNKSWKISLKNYTARVTVFRLFGFVNFRLWLGTVRGGVSSQGRGLLFDCKSTSLTEFYRIASSQANNSVKYLHIFSHDVWTSVRYCKLIIESHLPAINMCSGKIVSIIICLRNSPNGGAIKVHSSRKSEIETGEWSGSRLIWLWVSLDLWRKKNVKLSWLQLPARRP